MKTLMNQIENLRRRPQTIAYGAVALSLATIAGWIVYSKWAINHDQELLPALPGEQFDVETVAGSMRVYAGGLSEGSPLLLVHSPQRSSQRL